jgi:tRNA dimethylallyltransferase
MHTTPDNCLVVLGTTASGKTRLACQLAQALNGEIISADSRQVYRRLDIGTGKDLESYVVNGQTIPYHLISIADPREQFYLHQFAGELLHAFNDICNRRRLPVICGGTGLYLDALRKDFSLTQVPEDENLRHALSDLTRDQLMIELNAFPEKSRAHVDLSSKKRIIRGIEVARYVLKNGPVDPRPLPYRPYYLGISAPPGERRKLIAARLGARIKAGLGEEVETLVSQGISFQRLELLGLEYKFVALYLQNKLTFDEMKELLLTAIFQYAKRQATWFRRMEREGVKIHWVNITQLQSLIPALRSVFATS